MSYSLRTAVSLYISQIRSASCSIRSGFNGNFHFQRNFIKQILARN